MFSTRKFAAHLSRPKCAIHMHPFVCVQIEQPTAKRLIAVADAAAKAARARVIVAKSAISLVALRLERCAFL